MWKSGLTAIASFARRSGKAGRRCSLRSLRTSLHPGISLRSASSRADRDSAAGVDPTEQRELTFQKVAKLLGDKRKAPVLLSDRDKDLLADLIEPSGKLKNFWLDIIVARPELLTLNSQTLLKYEKTP